MKGGSDKCEKGMQRALLLLMARNFVSRSCAVVCAGMKVNGRHQVKQLQINDCECSDALWVLHLQEVPAGCCCVSMRNE